MTANIYRPPYDPTAAFSNPVTTLGPAQQWVAVTTGIDYGFYARWLYCGGTGGTVTYITWDGITVSNFPVLQGQQFFMESKQVVSGSAVGIWVSI